MPNIKTREYILHTCASMEQQKPNIANKKSSQFAQNWFTTKMYTPREVPLLHRYLGRCKLFQSCPTLSLPIFTLIGIFFKDDNKISQDVDQYKINL